MTAIAHAQMVLGNHEEALKAAERSLRGQPEICPRPLDADRRERAARPDGRSAALAGQVPGTGARCHIAHPGGAAGIGSITHGGDLRRSAARRARRRLVGMSADRVERKLSAILAADVAGYSRLMGADEEGTLASLNGHRREHIDPCIAKHRGRIVKTTGDGFLVEFASVMDAVRCAVEVQAEWSSAMPRFARAAARISYRHPSGRYC